MPSTRCSMLSGRITSATAVVFNRECTSLSTTAMTFLARPRPDRQAIAPYSQVDPRGCGKRYHSSIFRGAFDANSDSSRDHRYCNMYHNEQTSAVTSSTYD